MKSGPRLLTIRAAAERLDFSISKTARLVRGGNLPAVKIGGLWYVKDLDDWLDQQSSDRGRAVAAPRRSPEIDDLIPAERRF